LRVFRDSSISFLKSAIDSLMIISSFLKNKLLIS
jgi:hypothetical protein